eukprot:g39989.t1
MPKKLIRVFPNQKPWMNRKIHSLLKSRSEAFKLGAPDLYRISRPTADAISLTLHSSFGCLDNNDAYVKLWTLILHSPNPTPATRSSTSCARDLNDKMKDLVIDFRKQSGGHVPVSIDGVEVEIVENFKFLGINITNNLSWSIHINAIVKKAYQHLDFLRRLRRFSMSTIARRQLSDTSSYHPLDHDPTPEHQNIISRTIHNLITSGDLPSAASNLIVPQPRTARFYLLLKIHKPDCPGQPIVSACSCPIESISAYLDSVFYPLVQELPTYTKGVAMGSCMGPSYACLFIGYVEQSLFRSYTG